MLFWFLSLLPFIGALGLVFFSPQNKSAIRSYSLVVSLMAFIVNIKLIWCFPNLHWVEKISAWQSLGIDFSIALNPFNIFLILLTTFFVPVVILASYEAIQESVRGFHFCLLLLEGSMIGVFLTSNLWIFYIFWEVMLIPMYFLIGIWGSEDRQHAAIKFVLFTLGGSLFMLISILTLGYLHYQQLGNWNFDISALQNLNLPFGVQKWIFIGLFLGFAVKVPLVPVHTWLPDAHGQAPTAGSVLLAAILLKMGVYGFVRVCMPLLPDAVLFFSDFIAILSVIGILYGAMLAMAQTDIKRLIAYSSISHLGFCMLGVASLNIVGVTGGLLQALNHAISTGALFLLVGMLYERAHTKKISDFGGLADKLPVFTVVFAITTLSSIGLPGLNNFVGEFLCLFGAFQNNYWWAIWSSMGVVLAAGYMLFLFKQVFYGSQGKLDYASWKDLTVRELGILIPLLILMVGIGIFPRLLLNPLEKSANDFLKPIAKIQSIKSCCMEK